MRKDKRRRLERAGWKIGDATDFLQLSDDERRLAGRGGQDGRDSQEEEGGTSGTAHWAGYLGCSRLELLSSRFLANVPTSVGARNGTKLPALPRTPQRSVMLVASCIQ